MTSNPTTYKRQVTFYRGLINFPDFTKFLPKASPLHFFQFSLCRGRWCQETCEARNSWGFGRTGWPIRFTIFHFFRTVSMVAPSQYKCHDVVVGCVLADICMCISPSLIHFTFLIASSMCRPVGPKHLLRLLGA